MFSQAKPENAVAAIRVSTTKQGTEGDSPEAQKEQIERFAANRNITIKKIFLFLESASKEQQPMQEAIDYCKNPKHGIQLFVVKSIDRFTRGGSYSYSNLKRQLEDHKVRLIDIYGIIGSHKVNTLDHLGVSYKWSVYDPTKNSEILEAERASDEKRDIMSRMIGAEIRYTRLGYWNREAPLGFVNVHVETMHGKRTILEPHPVESQWIKKIFELRCRGNVSDREIVREVNKLGFRTRTRYRRDRANPMRIISKKGGQQLSMKSLWRYVRNPLYAGINNEVWLLGELVCPSQEIIEWVTDAMRRSHKEDVEDRQKMATSIQTQIDRIKRMDDSLYEDKLAGDIASGQYAEKHQRFNEEVTRLQSKLSKLGQSFTRQLERNLAILKLSQKAAKLYQEKSSDQKRLIISLLFGDLTLRGGELIVTYTKLTEAIADKVCKTYKIMEATK